MSVRISACRIVAFAVVGFVGLQPASAFDAMAWSKATRATGTTFYRCQVTACGGVGYLVSIHDQSPGQFAALADFRRQMQTKVKVMAGLGIVSSGENYRDLSSGGGKFYLFTARQSGTGVSASLASYAGAYVETGGRAWTIASTGRAKGPTVANLRDLAATLR